jgi:putative FmdB family regulatory protein
MPVYTYQCENCGLRFDRQQSFSDRQLTRCPECNKNALRRVYQPVGVVFKGSGFYVTDNRSSAGGGRANASTTDNTSEKTSKGEDGEKTSEPKAEKKKAEKSESKASSD